MYKFFFVFFCFFACTAKNILPKAKMIDILTDICIAQSKKITPQNNSILLPSYTIKQIYTIHQTNEIIFIKSYQYYVQNHLMTTILCEVENRLQEKLS